MPPDNPGSPNARPILRAWCPTFFLLAFVCASAALLALPQTIEAAAPQFIQEAETVWNTATAPKTTASFDVLGGDVLVAYVIVEGFDSADTGGNDTYSVSGGTLSWTNQQTVQVNFYTWVGIWTAVVDTDKSMTGSITRNVVGDADGLQFGGNFLTFRGSDGVGASNKTNVASGAPTLDLLTTQDNSAIVVANGDWTATDGASRTWRTNAGSFNETTYLRSIGKYTVYGGYHPDAGAAATYAVGLSAPSGQKYSIAAVEVLGSAAAPSARTTLLKPPNNLGLVGYWSFNDGTGTTATDFSGNRNTGTLSGSTPPAWISGKRGNALNFDGSNSYVDIPTSSSLDIQTDTMTVSAWIKADATGGSIKRIVTLPANESVGSEKYSLYLGANVLTFIASTPGGDGDASTAFTDTTGWHHVVGVYDGEVNTGVQLYVDGIERDFELRNIDLNDNTNGNFQIGRYGPTFGQYFDGAIDEVRVYNRALGATEVAALAKSGAVKFTSSSVNLQTGSTLADGLVGLWTFDGPDVTTTITDRSGSNNNGYFIGGATSSAKVIGKLGQALNFITANSAYVSVPADASLDLETRLAISAWINISAQAVHGIFSRGAGGTSERWYFYVESSTLVLGSRNEGDYSYAIGNSPTIQTGEWVHVVGVMDSTQSGDDRIRLYKNGAEITNKTVSWTNGFDSTSDFTDIGYAIGPEQHMDGKLDDVRIYNRALSPAEVAQLYKLGTVRITQ